MHSWIGVSVLQMRCNLQSDVLYYTYTRTGIINIIMMSFYWTNGSRSVIGLSSSCILISTHAYLNIMGGMIGQFHTESWWRFTIAIALTFTLLSITKWIFAIDMTITKFSFWMWISRFIVVTISNIISNWSSKYSTWTVR